MKKGMVAIVVLTLVILSNVGNAAIIHFEGVLDGVSKLVIGPTGIYWDHQAFIKPGYHDGPVNDSFNGPEYVNGNPWLATWPTSDTRAAEISSIFALDTSGYLGFTLSTSYGHYFDNYQGNGPAGKIIDQLDLNRGTVTASTSNGRSAVLIDDGPQGGFMVYSIDLHFVPEPASLALLGAGAVMLMARRHRAP